MCIIQLELQTILVSHASLKKQEQHNSTLVCCPSASVKCVELQIRHFSNSLHHINFFLFFLLCKYPTCLVVLGKISIRSFLMFCVVQISVFIHSCKSEWRCREGKSTWIRFCSSKKKQGTARSINVRAINEVICAIHNFGKSQIRTQTCTNSENGN